LIKVENLTRCYGAVEAVKDFSLEIERGEIVGLLGHNGAGKTTVMKILTGFLEPSAGRVLIDGIDVAEDPIAAQKLIGYLPENAPLYPESPVGEYLAMIAELRQIPADEIEQAVLRAARESGLASRLADPIHTLSKGYRQRVGIAQAIIHDPAVLVLDEPTNGLDPIQIQTIRELIRRLGSRTTIILSTHILQEIEAVCDRVLVMIQGALVADSTLDELMSSDAVVLNLADGAGDPASVLARLETIDGVDAARSGEASDAGTGSRYVLACSDGRRVVPRVIAACSDAGWTIEGVAAERRTLESVFRELQESQLATAADAVGVPDPPQPASGDSAGGIS
jgi:ABC-2 type transport system ATP-binding protein